MQLILTWVRNNLVTVLEAIELVYNGIELIANAAARIVPGNKTVVFVHDFLARLDKPLKDAKSFLLKTLGSFRSGVSS